jgi:hypothetical protein
LFACSSGDQEASFTKDDMQQGKHQEYERKLHEQLQNQTRDTSVTQIIATILYYQNFVCMIDQQLAFQWPQILSTVTIT